MTKIITILIGILGLTGLIIYFSYLNNNNLGAEKIDKDLISLIKIIENDRQDNGKYKRRDKEIINGVEYEVHEYETSKGDIGYTIFMTKEGYKKAISTGVEKESREYNQILIKDNSTTTKQ